MEDEVLLCVEAAGWFSVETLAVLWVEDAGWFSVEMLALCEL